MVLLAILTGMIGMGVWMRQTKWYEIVILCGWGLLAAGTTLGEQPASMLQNLNQQMTGWFT